MTSFSEAVTRREQPSFVDPRTGELIEQLPDAPHEDLVAAYIELDKAEKRFKEWRTVVEDELVRRHGDRKAAQVVGDHEVDVDRGYTRVWDPVDLEEVLIDLETRGLMRPTDRQGVLVLQPPKVDGRRAAQLLNRVDGDALVELRRCFHWEQKGRAKVKVTPVAQLEP